jgi:hypothetical protein
VRTRPPARRGAGVRTGRLWLPSYLAGSCRLHTYNDSDVSSTSLGSSYESSATSPSTTCPTWPERSRGNVFAAVNEISPRRTRLGMATPYIRP